MVAEHLNELKVQLDEVVKDRFIERLRATFDSGIL